MSVATTYLLKKFINKDSRNANGGNLTKLYHVCALHVK